MSDSQETKPKASEEKLTDTLRPSGADQAGGAADGGAAPEEGLLAGPDPAEELEESRKMLQDAEERLLRLAADFENTKKRLQREKETALKFAEENILKGLLPSLDNLERAIEQGRETEDAGALLEGVEMTRKGLLATLEKFGLQPLDGVGKPFDPNFHEALAMEESDEVPENLILQEYQKGYMFKDRLLRAAKVVVSKGKVEGNDQARENGLNGT